MSWQGQDIVSKCRISAPISLWKWARNTDREDSLSGSFCNINLNLRCKPWRSIRRQGVDLFQKRAPKARDNFRVFLANYETPKLWRTSTQAADFILAGQPKGNQRARGVGRT